MAVQSRTNVTVRKLDLSGSPKSLDSQTFAQASSATAGSVTDTTSYPVATQATKTEKVTVDGGTEQTVTFTTAINKGTITDTTSYPVTDQDGLTSLITIDGGSQQTVTFSGVTTSNVHVQSQMDAQLTDCKVTVVGGQVVVTSDLTGATSAVVAAAGTGGLTWAAAVVTNDAAGVAGQMGAQLTGCKVGVVAGQVKVTSDTVGVDSSVAIGTGTATLAWATAVAGTGGVDVAQYTVVFQNPANRKWGPLTDVTASDGTEYPRGIYIGDGITGAALAAADVTGQQVLVGGPVTVDKDLLVFQNSVALTDEITNLNLTVEAALNAIGIYPEATEFVGSTENA